MDRVIGRLAPHDCLGCGAEGRLLCAACRERLRVPVANCYRCRRPMKASLTCPACLAATPLYRVRAAAVYAGPAKDLVWKLKFGQAQGAARELAALMVPLLDVAGPSQDAGEPLGGHSRASRGDYLIVPVPTATSRQRQRGYDQARLLAREVARQVRLPCVDALARHSQAHQVGAGRQQRRQQLSGAFRVTRPRLVRGARVILVDDVVTTGATLEAAAAALRQAGAAHIEAVTFAQPAKIT
jgi:ComF family protein